MLYSIMNFLIWTKTWVQRLLTFIWRFCYTQFSHLPDVCYSFTNIHFEAFIVGKISTEKCMLQIFKHTFFHWKMYVANFQTYIGQRKIGSKKNFAKMYVTILVTYIAKCSTSSPYGDEVFIYTSEKLHFY